MQTARGRDFIDALTECKDRDIFLLRSVQILVDHHYRYWQRINFYFVLLPSFLQVLIFWGWMNFVLTIRLRDLKIDEFAGTPDEFEDRMEWSLGDLNSAVKIVLLLVTLYLLSYDATVASSSFCCRSSSSDQIQGDQAFKAIVGMC